jgi:mono/diheme cytochrome c family protein
MENPDLIVQGYPDYSVLVQLMVGRLSLMPPFRENYFTQNQIDGIRSWIEEGAPNN